MKKITTVYEFPVIIEKESDRSYFAVAPTLQGCYTSGKSFNEVLENIKDAISVYVKDLKAEHRVIPKRKILSFTSVEVLA